MNSIIGHVLLHNHLDVLVGDPDVCEFTDRLVSLSETNKKFVKVSGLLPGGYYAYHVSSQECPTLATDLILLHDTLRPNHDLWEKDLGELCTALSSSVFICEEDKAFHAFYSYYALEETAVYDTKEIERLLKQKTNLLQVEKNFLDFITLNKDKAYVCGEEIISVTGTEYVPDFLRVIPSTHWSADISRRLTHNPAITLVGGVASNTYSEFVHVYGIYHEDDFVGIRVRLEVNY